MDWAILGRIFAGNESTCIHMAQCAIYGLLGYVPSESESKQSLVAKSHLFAVTDDSPAHHHTACMSPVTSHLATCVILLWHQFILSTGYCSDSS